VTSPAVSVTIRPATGADEGGVLRVVSAAFARDEVVDLWREVGPTAHASLVAELDGAVVGHVGLSPAWVDARRELVEVWFLSPLSVRPDLQGRGLGTRLVEAAIEAARASGTPALFLEGSPDYYADRGFESASGRGFVVPSARVPDPAFQCVVFDSRQPWMAGRLVYPDVWWRHDLVGLRDPLLADVEEKLGSST
jgi:putative acetyltransferase